MFVHIKGKSAVNTHHLCNILLEKKQIRFYAVSMTARENWDFKSEEDAKKAYDALLTKINVAEITY